jgi:hypothetical protein
MTIDLPVEYDQSLRHQLEALGARIVTLQPDGESARDVAAVDDSDWSTLKQVVSAVTLATEPASWPELERRIDEWMSERRPDDD